VGTDVVISHCAATPIGRGVAAEVELIAVDRRRLRFRVHCREEDETIGEGFHERVVIDRQRFIERCYAKAG
jgi:fluoroacetyl-CoA thioesterase